MNRFLRRTFLGVAVLFAAAAVLTLLYLQAAGLPVLRARTFWAALAGAGFFLFAGTVLNERARRQVFLLLFAFVIIETLLQAMGWLGLLPAVNTKEHVPWGRVYWTGEGLGNSIRNRYGWYFPEFDPGPTNRVGIIGDSFVEAVEVHRTRNLAALLREKFRATRPQATVLAFGDHGSGPANYLEMLKYAQRHFALTEAIIVVYLGNDVTDCSPQAQAGNPAFIPYALGAGGEAALAPGGESVRAAYERGFEILHRSPILFLPRMAASHCMCLQLPLSLRDARNKRKRMEQDAAHFPAAMDAPLARLGLRAAPFALNPSAETRAEMAIMKSLLAQAAAFARTNQVQLRLMTVPFFPPEFYSQAGPAWTARLGPYDFLAPDRELESWAAQQNIAFLSLAGRMQAAGLTPKEIQALYLSHGSGHFSEAGHRFAAEALQAAFFSSSNASHVR